MTRILVSLACAVSVTCGGAQDIVVIRDVTVIDVVAGSARPARTVVVRDGRIAEVGTNVLMPSGRCLATRSAPPSEHPLM
jgi:adenine deaminase